MKFQNVNRVRWKGSRHCRPWLGWCIGRVEYDMPLVRLDGQRLARRFYDEDLEMASENTRTGPVWSPAVKTSGRKDPFMRLVHIVSGNPSAVVAEWERLAKEGSGLLAKGESCK